MSFSIKSEIADELARELVAVTGESLTEAVTVALRERLERTNRSTAGSKYERIMDHVSFFAALPVLDSRPADEILGYDELGLPS